MTALLDTEALQILSVCPSELDPYYNCNKTCNKRCKKLHNVADLISIILCICTILFMKLQVAANHSVASDWTTAADARLRGCLTVAVHSFWIPIA